MIEYKANRIIPIGIHYLQYYINRIQVYSLHGIMYTDSVYTLESTIDNIEVKNCVGFN